MKTLDFMLSGPDDELVETEIKPFLVRHMDDSDPRFQYLLAQLQTGTTEEVRIRITDLATGKVFTRQLVAFEVISRAPAWCLLHLGKEAV